MLVTALFPGTKTEGLRRWLPEAVAANPTVTPSGMASLRHLLGAIKERGPFDAFYSSPFALALCSASVFALELGLEIRTLQALGQYANQDDGLDVCYPGHEDDNCVTWQRGALDALREICAREEDSAKVLMVGHLATIGGIVAYARGVTDELGIKRIVEDESLTIKGFVGFNADGGGITLE